MFYYRLYFFSGARIVSFKDFRAEGDEAALDIAQDHAGLQTVELWRGDRRVGVIEARRQYG